MADKSGTLQQQRNACFPTTTAKATGGCPLTGPDVAIVPMRYALDRSRYDEDPKKLKPLLKSGKWSALPSLKTRGYTLRQLYKGYVYVYDETEKTLHEYSYASSTGQLTRIKWADADIGKDERSGSGESRNYLIYPRKNTLRIAYSPNQWTWRICEHMRSNIGSRKEWMKSLDLPAYCITQSARDTLPLSLIADAAADVDKDAVQADNRFADSAIPPIALAGDSIGEPAFTALAADVFWMGSVPDKESALVIALDAPLDILNDLGMQLAADHVAYQLWQQEHEHKIQIAENVEALCGTSLSTTPTSVKGDTDKTRQYQRDVDAYFTQRQAEDTQAITDGLSGAPAMLIPSESFKAIDMEKNLKRKYSITLSETDYTTWKAREKWRRHVDLDGAHAYILKHKKNGTTLLQKINQTQTDFELWSKHIGTDPLKLFFDTTNTTQLHKLQKAFANLLTIYCQNQHASAWLAREEIKSETLFGAIRYGFSEDLKSAFGKPANILLDGIGDYTTLATRAGEINAVIHHEGFTEQTWIKELKQSTRDTYKALKTLATEEGKETAKIILLALIPSDSRLAAGKNQSMISLLRNMLIGQLLSNSPERIVVDTEIKSKVDKWKSTKLEITNSLASEKNQWSNSKRKRTRRNLGKRIQALETKLKIHELSKPIILDFQNNKYAELLRDEIKRFALSKADLAKDWPAKARQIAQRGGINATSITWGVILLNFINTANTYHQLTKDGVIDEKDYAKITYGAGYSANLLAAVFVESKWNSIKGLTTSIKNQPIGIMERSATYWSSTKGETQAWGSAVRAFNRRLVAMGGFAVLATALEIWDIQDDYSNAKSSEEKAALWAKGLAVVGMGMGGMGQLLAATVMRSWATAMMGAWFAFAMLILGAIYLFTTIALNYFKNDAVGLWLKNSSWSLTKDKALIDSPAEQAEEHRTLLEIQLSPQIHVRSTVKYDRIYIPKQGSKLVPIQNGAWIQWRLPIVLRGFTLEFNITGSKSPFSILPVVKTDDPIQDPFLDEGDFVSEHLFTTSSTTAPTLGAYPTFDKPNKKDESIVWQTWIPLDKNSDYVEFQIWYPTLVVSGGQEDRGYLYQLELDPAGNTESDGLSKTSLQVKSKNREGALALAIQE
ncbi:toxin VasX [Pseudomonas sp. NPDC087817]|uniref:toxin VasX n=1 Tax=Pseudomonas sp. NPDC087817 TaxID=3364451 RepID=UPI00380F7E17